MVHSLFIAVPTAFFSLNGQSLLIQAMVVRVYGQHDLVVHARKSFFFGLLLVLVYLDRLPTWAN